RVLLERFEVGRRLLIDGIGVGIRAVGQVALGARDMEKRKNVSGRERPRLLCRDDVIGNRRDRGSALGRRHQGLEGSQSRHRRDSMRDGGGRLFLASPPLLAYPPAQFPIVEKEEDCVIDRLHRTLALSLAAGVSLLLSGVLSGQAPSRSKASVAGGGSQVERGRYLVTILVCNDCHTPFKMGPKGPEPDFSRMLSGHPESMKLPPPPAANGPWIWFGAGTNTAYAGPWGIS